jgi:3-oxoacyl-[acyl-carrier protein] reductase
MRLQERVALVTGAASGFGAEIARVFASEGAFVAVADINEGGARSVSAEIGNAALPIKCGVSVAADVRGAVNMTRDSFGRLDIVVNNAGTTHRNKPMLDVTEASRSRLCSQCEVHLSHGACRGKLSLRPRAAPPARSGS